jgi:hypothetical protein
MNIDLRFLQSNAAAAAAATIDLLHSLSLSQQKSLSRGGSGGNTNKKQMCAPFRHLTTCRDTCRSSQRPSLLDSLIHYS